MSAATVTPTHTLTLKTYHTRAGGTVEVTRTTDPDDGHPTWWVDQRNEHGRLTRSVSFPNEAKAFLYATAVACAA